MLKASIIGYLGKDAELKQVNGKSVLNFSVAHTESFTNQQGLKIERTTWVDCGWWGGEKLAPWLKKGSLVHVEGAPSTRAYANKEGELTGELRLSVFRLDLLKSTAERQEPATTTAGTGQPGAAGPSGQDAPDYLPF